MFMRFKMNAEDIKLVFSSAAVIVLLLCCVFLSKAAVSASVDTYTQQVKIAEEVVSVEGVNGPTLKVGSLEEVNTNGNWPKNYSKEQ